MAGMGHLRGRQLDGQSRHDFTFFNNRRARVIRLSSVGPRPLAIRQRVLHLNPYPDLRGVSLAPMPRGRASWFPLYEWRSEMCSDRCLMPGVDGNKQIESMRSQHRLSHFGNAAE
jgi:hypothetical protein